MSNNVAVATSEAKSQKKQKLLILLCWLVYVVAYSGRYSYSSNINPIMTDFGVSESNAGLAVTLFSIAYGAGQIVNGMFCKRYDKRLVLPIALAVSALMNVLCAVRVPFFLIKYIWFVNGAAQSFLWSSLICILSQNTDDKNLKLSIVAMGTTTAVGTLLTYGTSALCSVFGKYRLSFAVGATLLLIVAVLFFFGFPRLTADERFDRVKSGAEQESKSSGGTQSIVLLMVTLAILAMFCYFIKDGVNTWFPTILKESYGLSDSMSIVFTLALPFASVFAAPILLKVNKKIKDFVVLCGIMYFMAAVCIAAVLLMLNLSHWLTIVLPFIVVALLMSGISNTITTFAPLLLRQHMDSGKATGILDGFCYLGSALSAYGLGMVRELSEGWSLPFVVLCVLALLAVCVSIAYKFVSSSLAKKSESKSENAEPIK